MQEFLSMAGVGLFCIGLGIAVDIMFSDGAATARVIAAIRGTKKQG